MPGESSPLAIEPHGAAPGPAGAAAGGEAARGFVRRVLPNGLTVVVREDSTHPLVAYYITVRTGSAWEGEYLGTGISHVVEHMLFKGTERRPVGALEEEARSYGGSAQGYTTYDTTSYTLTVNREFWSETADLLVDALFRPAMDEKEFLKERDVVLRELKLREDDLAQKAWERLFEEAYRVHPYRIPIIGYEPLVERLTVEDIRAYHRRHYHPNRMVIGVAGDVKAEEVIRRLEELTAEFPPGRAGHSDLPEEPLPLSPRRVVEEAQVQLAAAAVGFPSVPLSDPDLFALDLLAWVLGEGRGCRLDDALKETGLVHSVHALNYTPMERGLFLVSFRLDPERMDEAMKRFEKELDRVRREPVEPAELRAAKRALLREYFSGRQSVEGQASDLASYEVLVGDPDFARRYLAGVEAVEPEDLTRVARQYLRPERMTSVRLYPKGTAPDRPAAARQAGAETEVLKTVLPNGVTLILKPDARLPLVTVQASMFGGVRHETEQTNGISAITARMLLRGAGSLSADEIVETAKRLGAQMAPFSGRNSLGLSLECMPAQLSDAVDLFATILTAPRFPAGELEKERHLQLAALRASEEDPFSWGLRRMVRTLFTVHPYRLDPGGTPESVRALKREDLVRFYRRALNPPKMVISAVGDFDPERMRALLASVFAELSVPAERPPVPAREPQLATRREHQETSPRQEALILIGFPGLAVDDPDVPALDLINTLLSGGAGRLFAEVRERRGLAYAVGAFPVHGLDPGAFILYAVVSPDHLEATRQALLDEVRRLRDELVPAEELERAKQGLLGSRRIARQTQSNWAAQTGLNELYGLGYDYDRKYDARLREVDSQAVRETARRLLDPDRCAVVIGRPEPDGGEQAPAERPAEQPVAGEPEPVRGLR